MEGRCTSLYNLTVRVATGTFFCRQVYQPIPHALDGLQVILSRYLEKSYIKEVSHYITLHCLRCYVCRPQWPTDQTTWNSIVGIRPTDIKSAKHQTRVKRVLKVSKFIRKVLKVSEYHGIQEKLLRSTTRVLTQHICAKYINNSS